MKDKMMKNAVLLVNLGTPAAPTAEAVRPYLAEFLGDRRVVEIPHLLWLLILHGVILRIRPKKSANLYQKIWLPEGSPLLVYSQRLIDKLQQQVGDNTVVKLAMRYGEPHINKVLDELSKASIKKITIIPLFPQYSATTTASVFDAVTSYFQKKRWVPELKFINEYADNAKYIEGLTRSVESHWKEYGRAQKLIISFHGIPKRNFDLGDPYYCFCAKTARLLAEKLGLQENDYEMVFQSRFGKAKWLQPYCVERLEHLPKEGVKKIDVICPGFSVDCLETLEEMAETNRDVFLKAGGEVYRYIPALNDSDGQVEVMRSLV